MQFRSQNKNELSKGTVFTRKDDVRYPVQLFNITFQREFRVVESHPDLFRVKCLDSSCPWQLRAIRKSTHKKWEITIYWPIHSFLGDRNEVERINVTAKFIARQIMLHVAQSPNFEVKIFHSYFFDKYNVDIPYLKAWHGRKEVIEALYNN